MWPEDLEPKHVYRYLRDRDAPVRANREITVLSNVMQQAIEMGLIKSTPCKEVRRNEEAPRIRDVSNLEVAGFMAHTPEWLDAVTRRHYVRGTRKVTALG